MTSYCAVGSGSTPPGSPSYAAGRDGAQHLPPGDRELQSVDLVASFGQMARAVGRTFSREKHGAEQSQNQGYVDPRDVKRDDGPVGLAEPSAPWWRWPTDQKGARYQVLPDGAFLAASEPAAEIDDDLPLGEVADETQGFKSFSGALAGRRRQPVAPPAFVYIVSFLVLACLVFALAIWIGSSRVTALRGGAGGLAGVRTASSVSAGPRSALPPQEQVRHSHGRGCKPGYAQDDPYWLDEDADCGKNSGSGSLAPLSGAMSPPPSTAATTNSAAEDAAAKDAKGTGVAATTTVAAALRAASITTVLTTTTSVPTTTTPATTSTERTTTSIPTTTTLAPTTTSLALRQATPEDSQPRPPPKAHEFKVVMQPAPETFDHNFFRDHSLLDAAKMQPPHPPAPGRTPQPQARCLGGLTVGGLGDLSLIGASLDTPGAAATAAAVSGDGRSVLPALTSRSYFATACPAGGSFQRDAYAAVRPLGKTLSYTVDLGMVGCGCNAALYLVAMPQNPDPSKCSDYYCDAASVCGVACAEVDIQEGNRHAWHSTLHGKEDIQGFATGWGGGGGSWTGPRSWSEKDYAPSEDACINTLLPFQVSASFPVDHGGRLTAPIMRLSQARGGRRPCELRWEMRGYADADEVSDALARGMTLVASYWRSDSMSWLDGKGRDGRGPCPVDNGSCGSGLRFSDFSIEDIPADVGA